MPITFREWILKFVDVDLPIGDLANDIRQDKYFPKDNKREVLYEYLVSKSQNDRNVLNTFTDAWDYYLKSR